VVQRIGSKAVFWLAVIGTLFMVTGCIGSDKPRRVTDTQFLNKPYIPPINRRLLVPAQILRDDQAYQKTRREINRAVGRPYKNIWNAHDADLKRINTPRKSILNTSDVFRTGD
jgi:hypothetical protein